MGDNKIQNGYGVARYEIKSDEEFISIDFSGNEPFLAKELGSQNMCLRNDASILFFSANSYYNAYLIIGKKIEDLFDCENSMSEIGHLILPYYFNFRHYVELELKALIVAVSNKSPKLSHKLNELLSTFKNLINDLRYEDCQKVSNKSDFDLGKKRITDRLDVLEIQIKRYTDNENAVEFYRYIFEHNKNGIVLNNSKIQLDYRAASEMFSLINTMFREICYILSTMIYLFYSL